MCYGTRSGKSYWMRGAETETAGAPPPQSVPLSVLQVEDRVRPVAAWAQSHQLDHLRRRLDELF
jgi:hypothetical protein